LNVLLKKRIGRYLTVLATIALMVGCATTETPPEDTPPALFSELEAGSSFYLNKDKQLGSEKNLTWQFLALQALVEEKQFSMADAIIASLQKNELTAQQSAILDLLISDNYYAQNRLIEAQTILTAVNHQVLNQQAFLHYLKLQVKLHIDNELPLEASDSLLLLTSKLITAEDKQTYNDLLLAQLILLSDEQLNQYNIENVDLLQEETPKQALPTEEATSNEAITAIEINAPAKTELLIDEDLKKGWYALAAIYKAHKLRPNRLTRELELWKTTYPDHSALQFMPLVLIDIPTLTPYQPDNIAVLLPLSGRFEKQGKAIQLGLLNAYYNQQKAVSAQELHIPKLHFFDTQVTNSEQLAVQLQQADIDFIVGPLMKKEIEELLPKVENIPVLALNSFVAKRETKKMSTYETDLVTEQESDNITWHYAFPLSPEEEAKQAAVMIHSDKHKNPLIIVPDSAYGKRVANAFTEQWAALTPESDVQAEAHYFQTKAKLNTFIADVLQTEKSKRRINQMKAITGLSLETEVRSRRDVDAIYIVSKRDELILLKPFIEVTVSPFATKIPLYASSRSHSFDRNNMQNKELSRLTFSDNPFLLDPNSELSKQVESAWKKQSFATLRLFALGFDSYQLIEQLVYLQNSSEASYKGLIGELSLDEHHNIEAQLSWAKYVNGELFEVASPITAE